MTLKPKERACIHPQQPQHYGQELLVCFELSKRMEAHQGVKSCFLGFVTVRRRCDGGW